MDENGCGQCEKVSSEMQAARANRKNLKPVRWNEEGKKKKLTENLKKNGRNKRNNQKNRQLSRPYFLPLFCLSSGGGGDLVIATVATNPEAKNRELKELKK